MTVIIVECFSFIAYGLSHHSLFSPAEMHLLMERNIVQDQGVTVSKGEIDVDWGDIIEVIHPYLGYVAEPIKNKRDWEISEYGFIWSDRGSPILKKSPDVFIIGIFGGSVAAGFCKVSAQPRFKSCLSDLQKEIIVLNFASGGYKQPQQLMILSYLLSLGAEFDLVINLDGFNEVALPPVENIPNHVNPFYPRMWHSRTNHLLDYEDVKQRGYIEFLKDQRVEWAELFSESHLYWSPMCSIIWESKDRRISQKISERQVHLMKMEEESTQYVMQGPRYDYTSDEQLFSDIAHNWYQSSRLMKSLCDASGIDYYHFLQPNQYVEGSKPMPDQERRIALLDTMPYKSGVIYGYPKLKQLGKQLIEEGVPFTDLTMIFSETETVLYNDACCHFNNLGYDLIFDQICQIIIKHSNVR